MVKSQDASDAVAAAERNAECRLERGIWRGRAEMKSFGGRIAVGDRLLVASDQPERPCPRGMRSEVNWS